MAQFKVPSSPKRYTTYYKGFRGVDFSTDPTQVDDKRSPWAPNLISDFGGNPEKRPGWRTLYTVESPVNGLWRAVVGGKQVYVAHGGTKLYKVNLRGAQREGPLGDQWAEDTEPVVIREGLHNGRSTAFAMNDKLWIFTGAEYLVYDGETAKDVSETAYVPTTTISANPAGGGTSYEEVNLIGRKRKNQFLADGTAKVYQLDTTDIDEVNEIVANGAAVTAYTVDKKLGQITFTTAPAKPTVTGQDNVFVTFSKTVEGYAERICSCTICTVYGGSAGDRVFASGNPAMQSTDWYCGMGDPSYWPDLGYAKIGTDGNPIVAYSKVGDYLAILKADNRQDATIYLRSVSISGSKVLFPVKQGISGVGAVSGHAVGYLMDEPLFLSSTGIYGIVSSNITARETIQNRSYYVDAELTKEPDLAQAVSVSWSGWYLVCVNGHCYVLDGRQNKSYKPQSNGDYIYECYYWDNIPATAFLEDAGSLYFGTGDGRICRFNTDDDKMTRYSDDGAAIAAQWATKADDDGDFMRRKTMIKKGSGVMLKPYTRSSAKIYVRTERDFGRLLREEKMDIWDWEDIDFSRIGFNSNDAPQVVPFNSKVKKYLTAQIIIKNDAVDEGFGIYGIIKRYTIGNYAK